MTTPEGPSSEYRFPEWRRRITVLSNVGTPSSFSVAIRTEPVSGSEIGWAHFRPSNLDSARRTSAPGTLESAASAWQT